MRLPAARKRAVVARSAKCPQKAAMTFGSIDPARWKAIRR
jgi:hypothetical protein